MILEHFLVELVVVFLHRVLVIEFHLDGTLLLLYEFFNFHLAELPLAQVRIHCVLVLGEVIIISRSDFARAKECALGIALKDIAGHGSSRNLRRRLNFRCHLGPRGHLPDTGRVDVISLEHHNEFK